MDIKTFSIHDAFRFFRYDQKIVVRKKKQIELATICLKMTKFDTVFGKKAIVLPFSDIFCRDATRLLIISWVAKGMRAESICGRSFVQR